MKTFLILDTHALIHRFFHALPPMTSPNNEPVNAVYGVANIILKILREEKPNYLAAAFDRPEKTFREEAFQDYKIQRPAAVPELITQFKLVRELMNVLRLKIAEMAGYEADDLIGSLVEKFKSEPDLKIIIISGDRDLMQLVEDDRVVVQFLKRGLSDSAIYNEEEVGQKYGLRPKQLPDLKGLVGDASDNIPGVLGIGPRTATPLLQKYGTLENLYENLWELPSKIGNKLESQKEPAFFSKQLATIKKDVPLAAESLEEFRVQELDKTSVGQYFRQLGFISLVNRLENI